MRDGSDAIADWPILNALLNASAGATWVSVHHGGGVGIGYSLHAGMVIVADGTADADERLERVLTCDPGIGVARHADAGYRAIERSRGSAADAAWQSRISDEGAARHIERSCTELPDPQRERQRESGMTGPADWVRTSSAWARSKRPLHEFRSCSEAAEPAAPWLLQRLRERTRPHGRAVHRHRALRHDARAVSPGGDIGVAIPVAWRRAAQPATAREAFDALLAFFDTARAPGGEPCTFLLDEVLELRTFESFPGLRHVLRDLLEALAESPNRFVLTTRYVARAHRLLRDATARFEVMHHAGADRRRRHRHARARASTATSRWPTDDRDYLGRAVQALTDGRAVVRRAIGDTMAPMRRRARSDQRVDRAAVADDGVLNHWCRFCYELRLHRARGYGALKAILDILAEEEPLTLTEISQRLHRTPGSTKDYLSWLEDVDLVVSRQKRYSFTDPLLRLWVRLHCRPIAADRRGRRARGAALRARPRPDARGRAGARLCRRRRDARRA